jgi:hypothetical protein
MRSLFLAVTTSLLVAGVTFACSGSSAPAMSSSGDVPDAGDDPGANLPPPSNPPGPDDSGAQTPSDAGASDVEQPQGDASDVGDGSAGLLCQVGDTKESEDNDSPESADPVPGIPSGFCGHLEAGDTDYLTFTLDAPTFKSSWSYSASPLTLSATVEGKTFDLASSSYVYEQGKTYVIKITAAAATDYRLRLLNN